MRSGAFSCVRGRGCYVEIVHGDPFDVDFVVLGSRGVPDRAGTFFLGEGGPGWDCVIPTQSLCGIHTVWVCVGGTRKV